MNSVHASASTLMTPLGNDAELRHTLKVPQRGSVPAISSLTEHPPSGKTPFVVDRPNLRQLIIGTVPAFLPHAFEKPELRFSYTIIFRHEDLGGDVPSLIYMLGSPLKGRNAHVSVSESVKGTELMGTFPLRFEGETTHPISHDATPQDIQDALNDFNSIALSSVVVSGGKDPIRSGPSLGIGGMSTQVGGRIKPNTLSSLASVISSRFALVVSTSLFHWMLPVSITWGVSDTNSWGQLVCSLKCPSRIDES